GCRSSPTTRGLRYRPSRTASGLHCQPSSPTCEDRSSPLRCPFGCEQHPTRALLFALPFPPLRRPWTPAFPAISTFLVEIATRSPCCVQRRFLPASEMNRVTAGE